MAEVCRRIRRAISAGQPLHGMKFYETFEMRSEKADDLPRVYIVDYSDKEEAAGGAPTNSDKGINSVIRVIGTLSLQLVCDRKNGWLSDHSVTNIKKMGALSVRNLLLDEIERDDYGDPDCSLSGKVEKPPMWATRESGIFDLGIVMDVSLTLYGLRMNRCQRSCLNATQ